MALDPRSSILKNRGSRAYWIEDRGCIEGDTIDLTRKPRAEGAPRPSTLDRPEILLDRGSDTIEGDPIGPQFFRIEDEIEGLSIALDTVVSRVGGGDRPHPENHWGKGPRSYGPSTLDPRGSGTV